MQVLHFVAGLTNLALAPYADVCYADELRMLTYAMLTSRCCILWPG
jgi:hypothetical protein